MKGKKGNTVRCSGRNKHCNHGRRDHGKERGQKERSQGWMVSGVGHGNIARHNARGLALILRQPGDIGGCITEKLSFKRHGYVEEGLQVNKIRK